MADPVELAGENAFGAAFTFLWSGSGVTIGNPLDISTCRFEFDGDPQVITVDIARTSVYVDRSNRVGVMAGFPQNSSVIRASNLAGTAPMHLLCAKPIKAAGANVSAITAGNQGLGKPYHAIITVKVTGDPRRYTRSVPFVLSDAFDTAPWVAVRTLSGAAMIEQVWFDVHGDSHVTPEPEQVAINEFWFVE